MKKLIVVIMVGCLAATAIADPTPLELLKGATTRPWPGKNVPELPALPASVVSNVVKELDASPAVRNAYAKLDAARERNVTWFDGVAGLEREKATWSLLSALCHPHADVQIHALRALTRLKDKESLPFLLSYAEAMADFVGGSESATIHGVIHQDIGKVLTAITGLEIKMKDHQDPEGVKAAVARCRAWLAEQSKTRSQPATPPYSEPAARSPQR